MIRRKEGTKIHDDDLVKRIVDGDDEAFRLLVDSYRQFLYRVVYAIVSHPDDAEDVAQEALVQIYKSMHSYEFKGLKAWMSRIAVNKAIDYKRRQVSRNAAGLVPFDDNQWTTGVDEASEAWLHKERRRAVAARLDELPERYRAVVYAYYIEERTYREIAQLEGVAVKTIESRLYRARDWIRRHWKEEEFQ